MNTANKKYAHELRYTEGVLYRTVNGPTIYRTLDGDNKPHGWGNNIVGVNIENGMLMGMGGLLELELVDGDDPPIPTCRWGGVRYNQKCLGCGRTGAICDDCELCAKCHKEGVAVNPVVIPTVGKLELTCRWGGTRYDEACDGCGHVTAICNNCELCARCHKKAHGN